MEKQLNHNQPLVMHLDLNSCFASIEQQANPHLRDKPLVVAAYASPGGCIVSPSIEAKKLGIRVGMTVREAKLISRSVIVREPDPMLVRDVHLKFRKIFADYSPTVIPKSIDEAVIDFGQTSARVLNRGLIAIAKEIKSRLRLEIGEWISCSVGIATNRFLAKLAASLHKPDGLDVIDWQNLLSIYQKVSLLDLNGINLRFQARLNAAGIFTPSQFLTTSEDLLRKQVFKSIIGRHWYFRLRGYEVDDVEFKRKSFGQEYSLGQKTNDKTQLAAYLFKLCEKMGRRLRRAAQKAYGIHLGLLYQDYSFWHKGIKFHLPLFTTQELFTKTMFIFNLQPELKVVRKLSVSAYDLGNLESPQLSLFEEEQNKMHKAELAMDQINDKYGEFVITPAIMLNVKDKILDRIAFGGVKDLEDLYSF
jgi:DNA polymerase-4